MQTKMRIATLLCWMVSFSWSQTAFEFQCIQDVVDWTDVALDAPWSDEHASALKLANEMIQSDVETARAALAGKTFLFHSLNDPIYSRSALTPEQCERMLWTIAIEEQRFINATPQETPDKAQFSLNSSLEPEAVWHEVIEGSKAMLFSKTLLAALVGMMVMAAGIWQWMTRRERRRFEAINTPEIRSFIDSILQNKESVNAVIELSLLSFHHGEHPLVSQLAHHPAWQSLTDGEKLVAALIYDDIPTSNIIAETRKNPGTIYNLRSTIRRKLSLPEGGDMRQALRELIATSSKNSADWA